MITQTSEHWNGARYDARRRNHVESYFFKATSPDAKRAVWLKATIFSSASDAGKAVAEGWAIAFDHRAAVPTATAVKQSLPFSRARFSRSDLAIDWDDPGGGTFHAAPGLVAGQVSTGERRILWDLRFSGDDRPLVVYPYGWMYRGPVPSSKQVSPYPDVRFRGHVEVGDERWEIDDWRGMQGHNWGTGHAERYVWCHCNQWDQDCDFVLEAATGRVRVGPVLTPTLTAIVVRHGGVDYPFNRIRQLFGTRADIGLRRCTLSARAEGRRIEAVLEAPVEQFVGLYYANPVGAITHCLNSKLATARVRFERDGQPPVELSTEAAALEIGTKQADHGVRMHV